MFDKLFSPMKIGNIEIPNRIVNEPMGTSYSNVKGECTPQEVAFYAERARGGIGLVLTECMSVVPGGETGMRGGGNPKQPNIGTDAAIDELKKIADAVHAEGKVTMVEIYHSGCQGVPPSEPDGLLWSPSGQESMLTHCPAREMTLDEIKYIIQCFIDATVRAEKAGMDGVEIHCAHGYLLNEFLSPYTNHRTDEYGGSTENRCRIVKEIMEGIRAVLPEYPVIVRLSVDEYLRETEAGDVGIKLEEGVEICKLLESYGVDALDVSAGTYETMNWAWEPVGFQQGWKIANAKAVKEAVSIPVIACSVIRDPAYAEMVIEQGYTDFIGSARQFLADPYWPTKAKEGRVNEIRRCISCLNCMECLMVSNPVTCSVNPRSGHEAELEPLKKDGEGRKVVVVGAGPAGLEAAHALYERGFVPVVIEAKSQVGGQLNFANKAPMKDKIDWLIGFQRAYCEKHGIQIKLDTPATVENIKAEDPYKVIWAAGALPVKPGSIPGVDLPCVVTPPEVLSGAVQIYGKNVCVVGSGMTGIETAEYLAEKGNKVNVYEMVADIGPGMHFQTLIDVLGRLMPTGAGLFPCHRLVKIEDGKAEFEVVEFNEAGEMSGTGQSDFAEFDYLVLSLGTRGIPVPEDIAAAFPDIIAVGDAEKAGRIQHATSTGYMAVYNL